MTVYASSPLSTRNRNVAVGSRLPRTAAHLFQTVVQPSSFISFNLWLMCPVSHFTSELHISVFNCLSVEHLEATPEGDASVSAANSRAFPPAVVERWAWMSFHAQRKTHSVYNWFLMCCQGLSRTPRNIVQKQAKREPRALRELSFSSHCSWTFLECLCQKMAAYKTVKGSKRMWPLFIFTGAKERYRTARCHTFPLSHFLLCELSRLDRTMRPNFFSPLLLSLATIPHLRPSAIFGATSLPINAHIKWILFIHSQHLSSHFTLPPACLSALGYGETWRHTLFFFLSPFPFCLLFFPPTTAGSSWPLIYEGLLNPCGSVWSTQGNFGVRWGSVVKTEVIYCSTCLTLLGLVRMLLEAPSANCSIWLQALVGVCV